MDPVYVGDGIGTVGIAILMFAVVFLLVGLSIIRRITRNPEDGDDHWRSHK